MTTVNYKVNTAGGLLTSVGYNGTTWTTTNTNGYQISPSVIVGDNPSSLQVNGKLVLNGQDLEERLKTIEKVLMIPKRDIGLEKKYPKLKKMYDDYITALGKYRTFESIKGDKQ